ncbi:MAG: choice-of-anchor L domain-containing protein [Paracoccaceae bacterium]
MPIDNQQPANVTHAASPTHANTLTPVSNVDDIESVLVGDSSINLDNITYTGAEEAISLLEEGYTISEISGTDPTPTVGIGSGIFLSTGGAPGTENTSSSFTVSHGQPGNASLDQTVQDAFPGAGETQDAAVVSFTFDSADVGDAPSISLDVFFGSDEYPEFVDSAFVDIAAIYVNGVNYALFNQDPNQPLSIVGDSINSPGNFFNNNGDDGSDGDPYTGTYDTEYDGFSTLLNILAPIQDGENEITIAIADTGDTAYDSGLFVGNLQGSNSTVSGSYVTVEGTGESESFEGNAAPQLFNLGGGSDSITGSAEELDGDVVSGFGDDDRLIVEGASFGSDDVTVTMGSAILDIDTDGDGVADTTITLEGDFSEASFSYLTEGGNTTIDATGVITGGVDLTGTAGSDTLTGTSDDDTIAALGGDDIVEGDAGNDEIDAGNANDFVDGGAGNDTILGGQGNDSLLGRDGDDWVDGGDNHDNIALHEGDDYALGSEGNDSIGGGEGNDTLYGNSGNDVIGGGTDDDYINAGADQDVASGGYGADTVIGGSGDDTLAGSFGNDTVDGGSGNDSMGGGLGTDTLTGGTGSDQIGAGDGDDFLFGEAGADFLGGGADDDVLNGGSGADTLNGGTGDDTLNGGEGADLFVFNVYTDGETDVIEDFEDGIDMIRLFGAGPASLEITDVDGGAQVEIGDTGQTIYLEGMTADALTAEDFLFV